MTKDELVIKLGFAKKSKEAVIRLLLKSTRQTVQSRLNIVLSTFRNNIVSNIILKVFFEGLITSASFCMSMCWRKQPKQNTTPNKHKLTLLSHRYALIFTFFKHLKRYIFRKSYICLSQPLRL